MKKTTLAGLMMVLAILSACGGGGGSATPAPPTKAVVTLSSSGTGTIGGIQATLNLPAGVTAKASPSLVDPSVLITDPGVVALSVHASGAETVIATYTTTTVSSQVNIFVAKSSGFAAGELVVINCDLAVGTSPAAADFTVTGQQAADLNGAALPGITFSLTSVLQ